MKIQIPNIKFKEYVSLADRSQYDYYLRYGEFEAINHYEHTELLESSFGVVKDVQEILNYSGLTWESLNELLSVNIGNEPLFNLQQQRVWFKEQTEQINELESSLGHKPSAAEEAAGLDRFNKYRSFPQLDKLMTWWHMSKEEVRALDYSFCFTKLKYEADKREFEEDINRILKRK
jgi:hypothetical protein